MKENIIDLINSERTIKNLINWFLFFLLLDIISTLIDLIFLPGINEKNLIARSFISKYGNVTGLMMAVPFEFVILAFMFVIVIIPLYILKFIYNILFNSGKNEDLNIFNLSLIITLLVASILHIKGIISNLLILLISL